MPVTIVKGERYYALEWDGGDTLAVFNHPSSIYVYLLGVDVLSSKSYEGRGISCSLRVVIGPDINMSAATWFNGYRERTYEKNAVNTFS